MPPPASRLSFSSASRSRPSAGRSRSSRSFPARPGSGADSAGLVVLLSLVVFAAPLAIWAAFSRPDRLRRAG